MTEEWDGDTEGFSGELNWQMKQVWLCYCLFTHGTTQRVNFPLIYGPCFPRGVQAGGSELLSELIWDLNNLRSRTQEMISRDHKVGGPSKQL